MNKYIKSPLNYTGGKFKLLDDIIPLFPSDIDTFVDLFGGGGNLFINVPCNRVVYNDICTQVVELLSEFAKTDTEVILQRIDSLINFYKLSKENRDGFEALRDFYNKQNKHPLVFYALICYAFNNQIRFNKNGEYNMPFGKNKSSFNPALRQKLVDFAEKLHTQQIEFYNMDFRNVKIPTNSFVYCDPPYLKATATYNENGQWTEIDEKDLLSLLDEVNHKGMRFALSNNFKYDNETLKSWSKKYNVHYIHCDYSNCNYHKKDKSKDTEVLITNY